ncbi:ankyrin repeat-containing domain protein [Aspergillus egyptiacus]|nr:ankyrin repeat-containing domain protein [Aspergillus egyptiacus]
MTVRLLCRQVERDRARGDMAKVSLIRAIVSGVDKAVDALRDSYNNLDALRDTYTRGLCVAVVGFKWRGLLHDLLTDMRNEKRSPSSLDEMNLQGFASDAASTLGRVSDMKCLIDKGARIKHDQGKRWVGSPVAAAATGGHVEALEFLIDLGADPNGVEDFDGDTRIYVAATAGHGTAVSFLLSHGADGNATTDWRNPLLLRAAAMGHTDVVSVLVNKHIQGQPPINLNMHDGDGKSALMWAVLKGHTDVVRVLLERPDVDVNCTDRTSYDMNILATAAAVGSEPVFGLLLSHPSIDFGAKDGSKDNILKRAAVGGSEHIVRKVLALPGIEINAQGADGTTPLMWAASGGHEAVVRLLLAQPGIKVHVRNYQYTVYSETQHDRETLFRLHASESRYPTLPECVRLNLAAGEIAVLPVSRHSMPQRAPGIRAS